MTLLHGLTDLDLSSFDSSKINEHAFESKEPISDYSFNILSNSTVLDLEVLESLYIHKGPFRLRLSESLLRDSRRDSNPKHRPLGVYTDSKRLDSFASFCI